MAEPMQPIVIVVQPMVCVFTQLPNRLGKLNYTSCYVMLCVFSQAIAPMQVVGGNRNSKNRPIGRDGKRDWSFTLFGCFGRCGLCMLDPDQNAAIWPISPHADHPRSLLGLVVPVRGLWEEPAASGEFADRRHSPTWWRRNMR
jgi:hypothetical protein